MRWFLLILLAAVLSAGAGFAVWYASSAWLPSYDDAAGRGLGEVYRLFFTAVYVLVAGVVFAITGRRNARALTTAVLVLLLAPFPIDIVGCMQNSGSFDLRKESFSSLQMFLPLWTVAVVQWLIVRWYIRRPAPAAGEAL